MPDGYSQIFRSYVFLSLRTSVLWLRFATLQNFIPSFSWIVPPALYPGTIQGKEGINQGTLELQATNEPGNQRTPASPPRGWPATRRSAPPSVVVHAVRSRWARLGWKDGRMREGREGGSGEATKEGEQRADRPPARVANFQQLCRRRLLRSRFSSVHFWTLHHHRHSSASRYTEVQTERERVGELTLHDAIRRNRFPCLLAWHPQDTSRFEREREKQGRPPSSPFTPWQKQRKQAGRQITTTANSKESERVRERPRE